MFSRFEVDYSLCLIADTSFCEGKELIDIIMSSVAGGVSLVQLREKNMETRDFIELAREIKKNLLVYEIPLIINDRLDVMLASQTSGVHVGQKDMRVEDIRQLLGDACIIGKSAENLEQLKEISKEDVDYIMLHPLFKEEVKTETIEAIGMENLVRARFETAKPLLIGGGIQHEDVRTIYDVGIDGIALASAICSATDPMLAAREFRKLQPMDLMKKFESISQSIKPKEVDTNKIFENFSTENKTMQ